MARLETLQNGCTYWYQLDPDGLRKGIFELPQKSKPLAMCAAGVRWLVAVPVNKGDSSVIYGIWDLDIASLKHDNPLNRVQACRNLGARKLRSSVPHLVRCLLDTAPDVCEEAVNSLRIINDQSALPRMVRRLGENIPIGLSNALGIALRSFPLSDTEPVVTDCLSRSIVAYRLGALRALAILPALEATDHLITALNDSSPAVRLHAADLIRQRPVVKASVALLARLDDEDQNVRHAVQQAAIATLCHGGLLQDDAVAMFASPIDLASLVDRVLDEGRVAKFDQMPSNSADTTVSLLVALTTACLRDAQALPQVMNALDDLTSASAYRSSDAAASIALVVALIAADVFRQNSRFAEAVRLYRRATELAIRVDAPQIEWRVWWAIGESYDTTDDAPAAFDAYRKAMSVIDALWFALLEENKLRGFFQNKARLYERAALNCLRLGYHALALEYNEKAKTRYLGDLIARRQKDPNTALARELQDFWRKIDHLRPLRVPVAKGGGVTVQRVEIVATEPANIPVDPTDATIGNVVAPEQWEALHRRYAEDTSPRNQSLLRLVDEVWNVAAGTAQVDEDVDIRNALESLYQILIPVYDAVRNGSLPIEEPERSQYAEDYDRVTLDLQALNNRNEPQIPLWAFREFERDWIAVLCASSEPGFLGDVLAAFMEALNSYLHHEPVIGVPAEHDGNELPAISFVTRPIQPESGSFSRQTALIFSDMERLQSGRWHYVMQLARGEICAYRDIVAALKGNPDTALVQFMVTDRGTFVFIIIGQDTSQGKMKGVDGITPENTTIVALDWPTSNDLDKLMATGESAWIGQYRERKVSPTKLSDWFKTMDRTIKILSKKMAMPLSQHLKRHKIQRLWLVPHRALHLVPFAALFTNIRKKRRLIDDFDICYAPSSTLQKICRERASGRKWKRNLAIIANPTGDLPFAEEEYRLVRQLLNAANVAAKVGLATRNESLETITQSMFHFAGHGQYQWDEPLSSSLKFADNSSLSLSDLFSEQVLLPETSMVALSACETNIIDSNDLSDEYLGLASGFLFAGTPVVLSTLWAVDDLSTAILITKFYELLLSQNRPSSALRQAQQWLRNDVDCSIILERFLEPALKELQGKVQQIDSGDWKQKAPLEKAMAILQDRLNRLIRIRKSNPKERPFVEPYFWAGVTIAGMDSDQHID